MFYATAQQQNVQHNKRVLPQLTKMFMLLLLLLLSTCEHVINAAPTTTLTASAVDSATAADSTDALVIVDERMVLLWPNTTNPDDMAAASRNGQHQRQDNADNESVLDIADDLIFLEKKPKQTHEQQQQSAPRGVYQQIDLLTSVEEDKLPNATTAATATNTSSCIDMSSPPQTVTLDAATSGEIDVDAAAFPIAGGPQQIELHRTAAENAAELFAAAPVTPIDMSDFVTLIPTEEVKSIAANYYHNDAEVRRAYVYLRSPDFATLRQHIIELPEVAAFLRYLNSSGLDVMRFLYNIANLTITAIADNETGSGSAEANENSSEEVSIVRSDRPLGNEINKLEYSAPKVATTPVITTLQHTTKATTNSNTIAKITTEPSTNATELATLPKNDKTAAATDPTTLLKIVSTTLTTAATVAPVDVTSTAPTQQQEQLNGLHGLVDGILDILPQDQILATFFDKLETNEQFSKLVNDIGSAQFAKILNKMQQSMPLRNLIFTLHNNGIYVTRIVDSLKSYFFLGGFS